MVDYSETERNARIFSALGNETRLMIMDLLYHRPYNVSGLVDEIKTLKQPTVTRHLSVLRNAGLVDSERQRQRVYYSLSKDSSISYCRAFLESLI